MSGTAVTMRVNAEGDLSGWLGRVGSALDIEETIRFALLNDVRPVIEWMPLEKAGQALDATAAR